MLCHKRILKHLLTSEKFHLKGVPELHGIYCLWDHLGRPIYIGETHSFTQNFRMRMDKHTTGSVDSGHFFSKTYNEGLCYTIHVKDDKSKSSSLDIEIMGLQSPHNEKLARKIKHLLIREKCRVSIFPIDKKDMAKKKFEIYLKSLENKVISEATDVLAEAKPFNRDDVIRVIDGCEVTLRALHEQEKLYLKSIGC